jgi:hypothetical protein
MDRAVLSLPGTFPFSALQGWLVGLTWRGFETWGQVCVWGGGGGEAAAPLYGQAQGATHSHALLPCCPQATHPPIRTGPPAPPLPAVQVSARNRWMVQSDWLRTKLFGRNLSEV